MTSISITGLTKAYDKTLAVDNIDLEISSGELFFLLGPSGCGKTTLLRMLAGFIDPNAGSMLFGDRDVTHTPPNKRNTSMVFQSYALWPHMSVLENVKYGLSIRKEPTQIQHTKAMEALEMVQMGNLAQRKPNELSGGQQQRVALARAIVVEPDVLLLDEPLSNLDAKLRLEMRSEIRRICSTIGMTTVYVTHDQKEALSIADRLAILREGSVMQVGSPKEVYQSPNTQFVAEFIGETNFVSAKVTDQGLETAFGTLHSLVPTTSSNVVCSLRPEAIQVVDSTAGQNSFSGKRLETIYLGEIAQHKIRVADDIILRVTEMNPRHLGELGDELHMCVDPRDVVPLPL